jgi:hypothetical protein
LYIAVSYKTGEEKQKYKPIQLAREAQAGANSTHHSGNELYQVSELV